MQRNASSASESVAMLAAEMMPSNHEVPVAIAAKLGVAA